VFCLNKDEFLEMAEAYKKAPCPVCKSPNLKYKGYTFVDGDMSGQLKMNSIDVITSLIYMYTILEIVKFYKKKVQPLDC
jgi:hypothetical protein